MQIPDFDFDTASHTGSRIRGYSKETLTRFAADLAAAQQEVARLRAALGACREALDSCRPGDYSTGHVVHPSFDEDTVNSAQDLLDGIGI